MFSMVHQWVFRVLGAVLILLALVSGIRARDNFQHASVIVDWSTASELDTAGFNLYRSLSPDGAFTQINHDLIPPSTDPLAGGSYHYTDRDVEPGRVYYYQLESVETNGASSRYGPIVVKAQSGGVLESSVSIFCVVAGISLFFLSRPKSRTLTDGQS